MPISSWKDLISLGYRERIICSLHSVRLVDDPYVTSFYFGKTDFKGALILTNRRLLYIAYSKAVQGYSHIQLDMPFDDIENFALEQSAYGESISIKPFKNVESRYGLGKYKWITHFYLIPSMKNVKTVIKKLREAVEVYQKEKYEKVQVVIDFQAIKSIKEGKGLILDVAMCPYCNGNIKLPEKGNLTTCEYCGRQIFATDIFQQLKEILGLSDS